jgi:DNA helicase-2/ATP-dependent DNA helicase PcrA
MNKKVQNFLDSLNPKQLDISIVTDRDINLITAGPGSGKTRTIIGCVAQMLEKGEKPESICVITFTNKAANELKERLTSLFGKEIVKRLVVGTYHAVALKILKMYGSVLGLKNFSSLSTYDSKKALKFVMIQNGVEATKVKLNDYKNKISSFKNNLITPKIALTTASTEEEKNIATVYREYQRYNWKKRCIDFDDMIWYSYVLLTKEKSIREKLNIKHLIVDECQDSNSAQKKFSNVLCCLNRSYFGDFDQSVYGWRGARFDIFSKDNFKGNIYHLEQNYRSTETIVNAATGVIKNNKNRIDMKLFTTNDKGDSISIIEKPTNTEEMIAIASNIKELIKTGANPKEIAIFYRVNSQSREIEHQLKESKIPYKIIGGMSFYERKEIKDIIAMLKVLNNPRDNISLERVLSNIRGIGITTINKLIDKAEKEDIPLLKALDEAKLTKRQATKRANMILTFRNAKKLTTIYDKTKLLLEIDEYFDQLNNSTSSENLNRVENIKEFLKMIKNMEKDEPSLTLQDFIDTISLESTTDKSAENDKICLMTLHASKGLEFDNVFIIGSKEGILPHRNSSNDKGLEEERRLFYVGMTRAKRKLTISYSKTSREGNNTFYNQPSRFIFEIPSKYTRVL